MFIFLIFRRVLQCQKKMETIYLPNRLKNIKKRKKKRKSTIISTAWTVQLCQQSEVFLHKKAIYCQFSELSSNLADLFLFFISISSKWWRIEKCHNFCMCFYLPFFLLFANFSIGFSPCHIFPAIFNYNDVQKKLEQQNNSFFNPPLKAKHNLREYYLKNKNSTHH